MKNLRLLAAVLFASAISISTPAQQNEDFAALRAKAEKGNGIAQYNLGLAYAEGRGVPADRIEAFVWLSLARENGARGRALDNLVSALDPASLEAARERLAERKGTAAEKIPIVTTRTEPEIVTTIKTGASSGQETTALAQQVAALTADKKQLSEEVSKAWKEIDVLNTALSKAEKDARSSSTQTLEQKSKELRIAAVELENLGKFSRELEASLNRTAEQKSSLEKNLATARTDLARTQAELTQQVQKAEKFAAAETARLTPSAEVAALRNQLTAMQGELQDLAATKTALATAQSKTAALTSELAGIRATETKLRDAVADLEQEKTRLSTAPAYPDLSGKVGELEAQLTKANRNIEASTQAASVTSKQTATDLSASTAEILRLQNALAAKNAAPSYPDLSGKVRELEATAATSTQRLALTEDRNFELQRQLAEATSLAQANAKAHDEGSRLKKERDEFSARAASLASENGLLRTDRDRLQRLVADSGKQLRDSAAETKRFQELQTEKEKLQAALNSSQTQIANLQSSLAAKSDSPAYPDLSGKVHELETKLAATNRQADAAVKTAVAASNQNTADLNTAAAQIAQLQAQLSAKSKAPTPPDLSGRVSDLEAQLASATSEVNRSKQEITARAKARDEAGKSRGPAYPNLAGRVVELQTALADAKRELTETQTALQAAQQSQAAASVAAVVPGEPAARAEESTDLQKRLAETENKLQLALRGYAVLQREHDQQTEKATKASDAVTALTAEIEQLKIGSASRTAVAQGETTRSAESLAALQRSTSQTAIDLAATKELLQQVQGANAVLARENYQLKSRLSPGSVAASPAPPAASTPVASVTPAVAARTHVVASGDTLSRISQRYYGTPGRWQDIYKANAAKLGANGVLRIGSELAIP